MTMASCFADREKDKPNLIDKGIKNIFRWEWLEETVDGITMRDFIRKLKAPGKAKCIWCDQEIVYGSRGYAALKQHAGSQKHRKLASVPKADYNLMSMGSSNEDRSGDGASTTEESMLGPDLLAPPETEQAVSPNPTTPSQQKPESYQLRHNNHMTLVLESLAQDEAFMDVTLTAQGRSIRAHKSVLSAVSPYFRGVLCENPCQHPIIIMPRDVRFDELQSIITYIYKGEMTVAAEDLSSLLKTAEILQVTGLTPADPQAAAAAAAASFNPQFSGSSDTPRTSKPRTYLYAQPKSQDTINPTDFMDMDMTCVKEEVMSGDEDGDEDEQDSASYPSQNIPHSKGNEPHHTSITQTSSTSSMTTATPSTQTRHTSDANVNPDPCTSPIKEDDEDLSSCQNPMSKEDPDPFVCPHCKEISRGYEALTLHLKVKHPSKLSFPCFCGRVYLRHARYVDHTKCCISQAPGSS